MASSVKPRRMPHHFARSATPAQRRLPCQCWHGGAFGLTMCGDPAAFRVILLCAVVDCDDPAAVYLLCAPCTQSRLELAGAEGGSDRLRVRPL